MKNVAEQALDASRLDRAIKLRVRGANWAEIASTCGYPSPASALRAVGEAMAAAGQRAAETADQMRDTANLRLEHLLQQTMTMIEEDAPERYDEDGNLTVLDDRAVKLRAVDEARRLVADHAKMNGYEKPDREAEDRKRVRVEIVGIDPSEIV